MQPDLHAIALRVAPQLGSGWAYVVEANPRDHWAEVTGPEGRRIAFFLPWRATRLSISGEFPRCSTTYLPNPPAIGASPHKAPATIARDIQRRLLPVYDPLLREVLERIRRAQDYERETDQMRRALQAVVGGHQPKEGNLWLPESLGTIHVAGAETVRFELRIPGALAVDFARHVVALLDAA